MLFCKKFFCAIFHPKTLLIYVIFSVHLSGYGRHVISYHVPISGEIFTQSSDNGWDNILDNRDIQCYHDIHESVSSHLSHHLEVTFATEKQTLCLHRLHKPL